ncbi:MAG: RNA-binding S4 domain-containing protein [Pseudomonadota bacterium]
MREGTERLDKWLWYTRFFKTRGLAAKVVSEGKVRVDAVRVSKPSRTVGCGDTLTFLQAGRVRVVRITGLPVWRGPAPEAQSCYTDLTPEADQSDAGGSGLATDAAAPGGARARAGPRPTKKNRRNLPDL